MLNDTQLQALATALQAETNQTCVDALAIRNDIALTEWVNSASTVTAWNAAMQKRDLFEATDVTKFDTLTAGKREAWTLMLDNAPIDMGRQKMRKAAQDVWGNTDSVAVLEACTRLATHGEDYLGHTTVTTNTVSAEKLNFSGIISIYEVSASLNRFLI